ncbi:MAG TPA: GntR family transcriptional regulator [Thermoanaerobacterales bacterium]|nr:GntR family transcriptional regulator [Thermoanaerobacterales bacterium]
MLHIDLDRQSGVPIYLQIKFRIKELIEQGIWRHGFKLPTERKLANELGLSRNTISNAYNELEKEGYIYSRQGKGTFVSFSENIRHRQILYDEELINIIDRAIGEALNKGYSLDDFKIICHTRIEEQRQIYKSFKIAFIECNKEQLESFLKRIRLEDGIIAETILLDDFRRNPLEINEILRNVDIIVTTFTHKEEVKRLLQEKNIEIIGIGLAPPIDTLIEISQIPENKKLGFYCKSQNFAKTVLKSVEKAGISLKNYTVIQSHDNKRFEMLEKLDIIITSPENKNEIEYLINKGKKIIEFSYIPDQGSINVLNTAIVLLQKYSHSKM